MMSKSHSFQPVTYVIVRLILTQLVLIGQQWSMLSASQGTQTLVSFNISHHLAATFSNMSLQPVQATSAPPPPSLDRFIRLKFHPPPPPPLPVSGLHRIVILLLLRAATLQSLNVTEPKLKTSFSHLISDQKSMFTSFTCLS